MKIALVISTLDLGGAERVVVRLAEGLLARGHRVLVVTLCRTGREFFKLPAGAERVAFDLGGLSSSLLEGLGRNLKRLRAVRGAIRDQCPDVAVGFMPDTNVLAVLAARGLGVLVVVTEHTDPTMHPPGRIWRLLRRLVYPFAGALVSVSAGVDRQFAWIASGKRHVIHNPVVVETSNDAGTVPDLGPRPTVLAMGRLVHLKGFDLLIEAFARTRRKYPAWQLVILGEGDYRPTLEQLIAHHGLREDVRLYGAVDNVWPVLRRAQIFVLPSRFEAFPNVLLEAMAAGLAVIAADCPSGPAEIVVDGDNGLLIPPENVEALAEALQCLMGDSAQRQRLAQRSPEVLERFGMSGILDRWERLFEALAGRT